MHISISLYYCNNDYLPSERIDGLRIILWKRHHDVTNGKWIIHQLGSTCMDHYPEHVFCLMHWSHDAHEMKKNEWIRVNVTQGVSIASYSSLGSLDVCAMLWDINNDDELGISYLIQINLFSLIIYRGTTRVCSIAFTNKPMRRLSVDIYKL